MTNASILDGSCTTWAAPGASPGAAALGLDTTAIGGDQLMNVIGRGGRAAHRSGGELPESVSTHRPRWLHGSGHVPSAKGRVAPSRRSPSERGVMTTIETTTTTIQMPRDDFVIDDAQLWSRRRSTVGCRRCAASIASSTSMDEAPQTPAQYVRRPQVHPSTGRGLDRSELGVFLFTAERRRGAPAHASGDVHHGRPRRRGAAAGCAAGRPVRRPEDNDDLRPAPAELRSPRCLRRRAFVAGG